MVPGMGALELATNQTCMAAKVVYFEFLMAGRT